LRPFANRLADRRLHGRKVEGQALYRLDFA
jgi:hypothetical protein